MSDDDIAAKPPESGEPEHGEPERGGPPQRSEPREGSGSRWGWNSAAGLAIGLGAGVALGVALDNLGLWMSLGLVFGLLISWVPRKPGRSSSEREGSGPAADE